MAVVVDTNVAVVAEGLSDQADRDCIEACQIQLESLMRSGGLLLLDEDGEILDEYLKNLGYAGQPGIGRAFVKWAFDHQYDEKSCRRIRLTQLANKNGRRYNEFPDNSGLATFDRGDQMFVAVALASGMNPTILHALDSGWWDHKTALKDAGVNVVSLCPQHQP